jgi:hypothetical protein
MTDMATYPGAFSDAQVTWSMINWNKVYRTVRRLQARIVKATQAKRWGKVKALQRLLTRSFSAKVLAIRRRRNLEYPGEENASPQRVEAPGVSTLAAQTSVHT